ncbi:MAG: hypothetical protein R3C19_00495 [Planctomycetaceae bacterium]
MERTRRPSRRPPVPEIDDFDDDFAAEDEADSPYENYEDLNPYAAPVERTVPRRRSRSRSGDAAGLRIAGTGMLIQVWSVAAIIIAVGMLALFSMVAAGAGMRGSGAAATIGVTVIGVGVVILAAAVAMFAGEVMCLWTPESTGAKPLIIASVSLGVVNLLGGLGRFMGEAGLVLVIIGALAGFARFFCFELFLRKVAQHVRRDDLASQAMIILVGLPSSGVLIVLTSLIMPGLRGAGSAGGVIAILFALVGFACVIAMLVFSVMHIFLLARLGSELRK